jgi:hypothetical protein
MRRELALLGFVGVAFGIGFYYAVGELGPFGVTNLVGGALALLAAGALALRHWSQRRRTAPRGPLFETALWIVAVSWGAVLVERAAHLSQVRFDWTFERTYELAPATIEQLACLARGGSTTLTLYYDQFDPRLRTTRSLLDVIAGEGATKVEQRRIEDHPDEADRFAIGSSNTVVVAHDGRFEVVERPSEGALFEAFARLCDAEGMLLYLTVGAGEGDASQTGDVGFSGLAAALETEGYRLRALESAAVREIPADADAVVLIAPERRLRAEALAALRAYLERGGRLVVFLKPGLTSGVEELLSEWGLRSPDALIVDPASGPVEDEAAGLNPLAFNYSAHPVTRGLSRNRMTFFRHARSFELHKTRVEDELKGVVFASGRSWLHPDPASVGTRTTPAKPPGAREDYHPIAVAARFPRGAGREARIVAFGDRDFASNRYLRTLYNLDLVVNAVHWVVEREPAITLRPKYASVIQFPLPIQNSLRAFYGVGLLLPELMLVAGGLVWLRRRRG